MPLLDVDRDAPDTGYNRTERKAIKLSGLLVAGVAAIQVRVAPAFPSAWFFALSSDYERRGWFGLHRRSLGFACSST
jgi:hypothetical protein